jgi:hypothetical protein
VYPTWLVVRDHIPVESADVTKNSEVSHNVLEQVLTLEDKEVFAKGRSSAVGQDAGI